MNFTRIASLLAIATAAGSVPAFAQDARETHFDGLYVSGAVGYAALTNDRSDALRFDTNNDNNFNDVVRHPNNSDAFIAYCPGRAGGIALANGCFSDNDNIEYAGRVGFDKRLGNNFVFGILGEVSRSESRDYVTGYSSNPVTGAPANFYQLDRDMRYALSARARAGYTPGGGALFYVTGGGSYAKINHGFTTSNQANTFTRVDDEDGVWGWQAGGGAEVMVTNNISLGLEYLYSRYNDDKSYITAGRGSAAANQAFVNNPAVATRIRPSDTDFDFHSLRATVGFHF